MSAEERLELMLLLNAAASARITLCCLVFLAKYAGILNWPVPVIVFFAQNKFVNLVLFEEMPFRKSKTLDYFLILVPVKRY